MLDRSRSIPSRIYHETICRWLALIKLAKNDAVGFRNGIGRIEQTTVLVICADNYLIHI
jgi:hypothetical protein